MLLKEQMKSKETFKRLKKQDHLYVTLRLEQDLKMNMNKVIKGFWT